MWLFCFLPSTTILNYTFSSTLPSHTFLSFLSYIHNTILLLFSAKFCKQQKYSLKQLIHKPPHSDVTAIFHLICLFIFSLAGILNFSTRHIGTIIFTLFYAPRWVCLQAHSQTSASSAADNLLSSVGLVYYSVPKGHSVLWVALIESCWIFYQKENQQWAEERMNFLSLN